MSDWTDTRVAGALEDIGATLKRLTEAVQVLAEAQLRQDMARQRKARTNQTRVRKARQQET